MQFNYYGFIVGVAVVSAWQISEMFSNEFGLIPKLFNRAGVWFGVGALVAMCSGYQNVSYFIRIFKKMYGVSPLKYRNFQTLP